MIRRNLPTIAVLLAFTFISGCDNSSATVPSTVQTPALETHSQAVSSQALIGWGTRQVPWVSNWTCNDLKNKNNVQFCFIFRSVATVVEGAGWLTRGVRVYFE